MSINRKRGSIALARSLCYQINGAADDSDDISAGGGYGSVDIAEILSAEVVRLQEALKLALDALENHTAIKHPQQIHYRDKAITAIKDTLAQTQEPVKIAHRHEWFSTGEMKVGQMRCISCGEWGQEETSQRTWVGLTDKDLDCLCHLAYTGDEEFALTVQAKLKEKNCAG